MRKLDKDYFNSLVLDSIDEIDVFSGDDDRGFASSSTLFQFFSKKRSLFFVATSNRSVERWFAENCLSDNSFIGFSLWIIEYRSTNDFTTEHIGEIFRVQ